MALCQATSMLQVLASDGGGSANINLECADLIAGKPAPTGFRGVSDICVYSVIFSKFR
jgi:hypothetical protein